jgi:hypothetical protein
LICLGELCGIIGQLDGVIHPGLCQARDLEIQQRLCLAVERDLDDGYV